ncbi:unnamed protein product [Caenorhabditis auriculariae]|uniref:Major facilitator superfamily (MFS) profile domain-containing protein n=1 Tax=Caenorhabditis auriculariae TaxID=2777116 RepID=A0A8S1HMQ9_9PELO|nr:unnamed protein product [Caenorhabditis auriculariae]
MTSEPLIEQANYRVYPERWAVLSACAILSMTNIMQWVSYSTIEAQADSYYCPVGGNCGAAFMSNQIFQISAVLLGVGGMYFTSRHCVLKSIRVAASLSLFGALIRMWAAYPGVECNNIRLGLLYAGTFISSISQVLFLIIPSKIGRIWFPERQRTMANVVNINAVQLGLIFGSLLPLFLIDNDAETLPQRSSNILRINAIIAFLCFIPTVMSIFTTSEAPPTPPSLSSTSTVGETMPFFESIGTCLKNGQFLVVSFIFTVAFASQVCTLHATTILDWRGYSLQGSVVSVGFACAIIGCQLAGFLVDRTGLYKEVVKASSVLSFVSVVTLRFYFNIEDPTWMHSAIIYILFGVIHIFMMIQAPICIEMGVEITFPVDETISTGILILLSNIWMLLLYFIMHWSENWSFWYDHEGKKNWKVSMDIWAFSLLLSVFVSLVFLWPKYKRTLLDNGDEDILAEIRTLEAVAEVESNSKSKTRSSTISGSIE